MRRYPPVTVNVYQSAFGQHIRQLRNRQGVTQEELAHRAGIHVTYLSGIERGVRNPSLKSICALAVGLEVPVSELFAFQIYPPDLAGLKPVSRNSCEGRNDHCTGGVASRTTPLTTGPMTTGSQMLPTHHSPI